MPINVPDIGAILGNTVAVPPALNVELGPSTLPLALLPVRLETRFFANELRVRIYPDKVHLDSHDPALDADELLWGKRFWELQWPDQQKQREAWRMLAGALWCGAGCVGRARADADQSLDAPGGHADVPEPWRAGHEDTHAEGTAPPCSLGGDRVRRWSGCRHGHRSRRAA